MFVSRLLRRLPWLLLAGTLMLAACEPPQPPLRIGTLVWPPYELFFVAREHGFYPPQSVELVEYRSPIDQVRAYQSGGLDAVLITADFALRIAETGPESRIALLVDYSAGGDAVVARPEIETVEDLAGRRVGVELSSLGLYMLRRALDLHDMRMADVDVVSIDYPELTEAYEEGRVAAVVVYEPAKTRLIELGAHQIFDSSQIPEEIVDVMVVRRTVLEARTRELRKLVDGWFEARELLRRNPESALPIMSAREGLSQEEVVAALAGVEIPGRAANRRLLAGEGTELDTALERLAAFMAEMGLLPRDLDPTPLLDDRLVTERPP